MSRDGARGPATARRAVGWLVLAGCLVAGVASAASLHDPGCDTTNVVIRSGVLVYRLPWRFIRAGSDSVRVGDARWRAGEDYALDPVRGELRLLREAVPGETLRVSACRLLAPPPTELQLMRYRPPSPAPESAGVEPSPPPGRRPVTQRNPAVATPGASLSLNGTKTIAVDFGSNQDAFLRQSLDLALSGTLAPGVELTGVLSDRNTPLTAAGSTRDIQSLDRVLIELRAPQGDAQLGDVTLAQHQGEFARIDRRLQGMRGVWRAAGFETQVAAANSPGTWQRLQFFGVDGRQGPYQLTDRDGGTAISIVAESEVVTVDGQRMTRGETADYTIDYERARVTFANRRPVSSASRITVEYQYTVNRYRRNLVAAGTRWGGGRFYGFAQTLSETDDRGSPIDVGLSPEDRLRLAAAGDSASRAIAGGVTAGGGDYDSVRVAGVLIYAFAGPDSGAFAVSFARVGQGAGDYADSTVVSGRTIYRYVGSGAGAYRVGRALPLPESHQLVSIGGGAHAGPLAVEVEGAVSRLDRNTFSMFDDGDNQGMAGRASATLEGTAPGPFHGTAGLAVNARAVQNRFAPFVRLERPFSEEDWGLSPNADLDHQRKATIDAYYRPKPGGELRASAGRLTTPDGFESWRRALSWRTVGPLEINGLLSRADGTQHGVRFGDGGRRHALGALRWHAAWIEPAAHAEWDERRYPSDSARAGGRFREFGADLASGPRVPWRLAAGWSLRRDAAPSGPGFLDQTEARTLRLAADSPAGSRLGAGLVLQRRDVDPLASGARTRSDLGAAHLSLDEGPHGLSGRIGVEITSEGQSRRERTVQFVGPGQGGYDALGNYVGTGDYDLVETVSADFERVARAATSALAGWRFGSSEAWRGSQLSFDFESEARRHGSLLGGDALVAPGAVLGDPGLLSGSVLQRLEADLAPGSAVAAMRVRLERRVSGDRTFDNFSQTLDDRLGTLRWRARPGAAVTAEVEARVRRQVARQQLSGSSGYGRTLIERGGTAQLVYTPGPRLRFAGTVDGSWTRPETSTETARTIQLGPDLAASVGAHTRVQASLRRAFTGGAEPLSLLPVAGPVAPATWNGSLRVDVRVRESTTLAMSLNAVNRAERRTQVTGRAELRAFF